MNDSRFGAHVQYPDDRKALMYLEDVWVQRHEDEPRVTTISFVSNIVVFLLVPVDLDHDWLTTSLVLHDVDDALRRPSRRTHILRTRY